MSNIRTDNPAEGITVASAPTGVRNAVTIQGSLQAGLRFAKGESARAFLTARMLEEGTKRHTKAKLHEALESRGIDISFAVDVTRVRFEIRTLKEHMPTAIALLAEMMREPSFPAAELKVAKHAVLGDLLVESENTNARAKRAFARALFPKGHALGMQTIDEEMTSVKRTTRADIVKFHKDIYGRGTLIFSAAGDVDHNALVLLVDKHFSSWRQSGVEIVPAQNVTQKKTVEHVVLKDKASSDLFMGAPILLDTKSREYYAFALGVFVLGGDFTARLMQNVREKQGLTYGTYARIAGLSDGDAGYWFAWGTFAPELLIAGKKAILTELTTWAKKGISAAELTAKKETIAGAFQVALADTKGLSSAILGVLEEGRKTSYLAEYPEIVAKITLKEVNQAIAKHIDLKKLAEISAGTKK